MVGIMKTDGGPHPADKWAQATASQIIDIGSESPAVLLKEARDFEAKIVSIMTAFHTTAQANEQAQLAANASHSATPLTVDTDAVQAAVSQIVAASVGTTFAAHFSLPATQTYLTNLIGTHFATVQHIERLWDADRNPTNPAGQAYKAATMPVAAPATAGA